MKAISNSVDRKIARVGPLVAGRWMRWLAHLMLCSFGWTVLPAAVAQAATSGQQGTEIVIQVGETRVLPATDIGRVAVGDGEVVHAVAADHREVLLFGKRPGSSSLHLWTEGGTLQGYRIRVLPADTREIQHELAALLEGMPNVRTRSVGDKLVVEGDNLSDADQARIDLLGRRYPQILDLTATVGWDQMVLLDVQVIEVPRSALRDLGVRWDANTEGGLQAGMAWDPLASGQLHERPGEATVQAPYPVRGVAGYFGMNALLSARLHALAQQGEAVVLAQPQLLARSGTTASFLAGGEVPYASVDSNGNTTTIFKPYGVSLAITPRVDRNGAVRSQIEVEVSSVDASLTLAGGPAMKMRRAATEFNVRSGQTLVLGGFVSREYASDRDQVPGLGNVPLLGNLFRANRVQRRETELAIFVTPVVVDQAHPDMQARVRQGREILDSAFPAPLRLNTPVRHRESDATQEGADSLRWQPYEGRGSQWQQEGA